MKLMTRGRFACAVLSWIGAVALLTITPDALAQNWPTARAGNDLYVPDTDGMPGEWVNLNGTASTDPDGDIVSYNWRINDRQLGQGSTLRTRLQDGTLPVTLTVYDSAGRGSYDEVIVTVVAPVNTRPTANAGNDRTIADNDRAAGENVTLNGTGSIDPDGTIASYAWSLLGGEAPENLGSGSVVQARLPDGENTVQLQVTDNQGATAYDTVLITVSAPAPIPPIANAGADRTINDSDRVAGELVAFDGSASTDPDGTIVNYAWSRLDGDNTEELGDGARIEPRLPDGTHTILLVVTDNTGRTAEDTVLITVNAPAPVPPTANAGADRVVDDTDRAPGENVTLDGSASTDPDGSITNYAWSRLDGESSESLGSSSSPTLRAPLRDGANTIRLVVTDNSGRTAEDTVLITVNAPAAVPPTANAGDDRVVNDTDGQAGETVTLDGSASSDPDGNIVNYAWSLVNGESSESLGSGPTLQARLPDGANTIQLVVTDNSGNAASDTVLITVNAPTSSSQPTANAGADRTVTDTDSAPGESVVLDGTASTDPNGSIASYTWSRVNGESTEVLGSGPTLTVPLPDGENVIRLTVTDIEGNTATDTVIITVNAPVASAPTANAGADRTVADTDTQDGEDVVLDASYSVDPDGTIVDYAWSRIDGETTEALGNGVGPTLQVRLADGEHVIQLVVTDNQGNTASDTMIVTVNKVVVTSLGNLPGLTPNQQRVGQALDRICGQLRDRSQGEGPQLSGDQQDLMNRCDGLQMGNTTANQVDALDELVADDFALARTQTLLFANTQYAGVMDRLLALRGGAKGLSLAGLNIIVDGEMVPLAQLQEMAKGLLGGGASADEPGGLLDDKWGLWARGNYSTGEKDRNTRSPGFDADQWAMVAGIDYRFNDQIVGGVSLAHGQSSIDIDDGEGGLETDSYAVSLYGSSYVAKKYYLDAIVNVANADYGADRNIAYVDGAGLVDTDARGETDGMTYSAGISGGRDFVYRGFTLSPTVGFFYIDATIDSFTEQGAGGLNLIYDEQSFQSFTGNFGVRATYAWNVSWGVLLPHVRIDYIREFKTDVDVFGVRFAADPNATSAPPILVETDNPDESYWRLATGLSAQFVHGISGYVEYQRLQSFQFISFQDVSMGLRFQKSF
jgi:outer membrane autotransporter protein